MSRFSRKGFSRRDFLKVSAGAAAAAAASTAFPNIEIHAQSGAKLSGELKILQWTHFVPNHDKWFDAYVQKWGETNGVKVTVDHIDNAQIPARAAAEITAGSGHDMIEYIYPPSALEQSLIDLTDINQEAVKKHGKQVELATRSSYNAKTKKYYGFSHGWVPDPGDYRKSMWEKVGLPNGPSTWEELLKGGSEIKAKQGVQMGIGMAHEIDSNMALRGVIWSFGGSEQDKDENLTLNSPETIAAIEYMKKLYDGAMTPEIFSWTAASNNQLLIAGKASWILNSISAYRTAQDQNPDIVDDIWFTPPLKGPGGLGVVSEHLVPVYIVPKHAKNVDAAKAFMLDLVANYKQVTYESKLYTFPAFPSTVPQLFETGGWLDKDPFGSKPENKLALLKDAEKWSTVIGHPGPANAAIGEAFTTFLIPDMFAAVAQGKATPKEAVEATAKQFASIYEKWRKEGLVGGTK